MKLLPVPFTALFRVIVGRRGRGLRALLPVAVGLLLPCLALLGALSFLAAADARSTTTLLRDGSGGGGDLPEGAARGQVVRRTRTVDTTAGSVVLTVLGGAPGAVVGIPGLSRLPAPGEVLVSPAVRESGAMAELSALLPGPPTRTLPRSLLATPNEQVVVAVVDPASIVATRDYSIVVPASLASGPVGDSEGRLLAIVMGVAVALPCAAAAATAVRVSATRRDGRYATLRLVGLTPRGLRALVAAECAVAGLVASIVALAGYGALLMASDRFVIGGWSAWTDDLRLDVGSSLAVAAAIVGIGVSVGAVASRRVVCDPVAIRQGVDVVPVRRGRTGWLAVAMVIPAVSAVAGHDGTRTVGVLAALIVGAVGVVRCVPLLIRAAARPVGELGSAAYVGSASLRRRAHESARPALGMAMVVYSLAIVTVMSTQLREETDAIGPADVEVRSYGIPLDDLASAVGAEPGVRAAGVVSSEVMLEGDPAQLQAIDVTVVASCADAIGLLGIQPTSGSCRSGTIMVSDDRRADEFVAEHRLAEDPRAAQPPPAALARAWPTSATYRATGAAPGAVVVDPTISTTLQTLLVRTDRQPRTLETVERLVRVDVPSALVSDRENEAADRRRAAQRTDSLLSGMAVGLLLVGSLSVAYAGWGTLLERRRALRVLRTVGFGPRSTAASVSVTYAVPVVVASGLALAVGVLVGALAARSTGGEVDLHLARLVTVVAVGLVPALMAGMVLAASAHRIQPAPPPVT